LALRLPKTYPADLIVARSVRRWELLPNFASRNCRVPSAWAPKALRQSPDATHNLHFGIFLFDRFQFALPPDWNPIILAHKVGIGPVDVRP
jgi:hypothetical protein